MRQSGRRYATVAWVASLGMAAVARAGDEAPPAPQEKPAAEAKAAPASGETKAAPASGEAARAVAAAESAPNAPPAEKPWYERIRIGGQVRARGEFRDPREYRLPGTFGLPDTAESEDPIDFVESRIRLHADAKVSDVVSAFIQIQDSRRFGDEGSALADTEGVDLHQGYFDVRDIADSPLDLRVGRQELSYGDQRLVSPLDWSNIGRAWDGARLRYRPEKTTVDLFATVIDENDTLDDDLFFGGLYATRPLGDGALRTGDVYVFWRHTNEESFVGEDGTPEGLDEFTPGARIDGAVDGVLDYKLEGAYQFGDWGGDDLSAYAVAAVVGHTFEPEWKPRIQLEYDYASGDDDPDDGDRGTFDALFPFGHYYQGFMDLVGWKNSHTLQLSGFAEPHADWKLRLDVLSFWQAEGEDAWYDAALRPVRRDATGDSDDHIGVEVDLSARWAAAKGLDVQMGYSHFFAGAFVDDTGFDDDQDWVWLMATVSF